MKQSTDYTKVEYSVAVSRTPAGLLGAATREQAEKALEMLVMGGNHGVSNVLFSGAAEAITVGRALGIMENAREDIRNKDKYLRGFCKYYGVPYDMIDKFISYALPQLFGCEPEIHCVYAVEETVRHLMYQRRSGVYFSAETVQEVAKDSDKFREFLKSLFVGKLADDYRRGSGSDE